MRICPQCRTETTDRTCPRDGYQTVEKARYDPERQDPLVGTVFDDRYRIESVLGRGGMGAVYRAVQLAVNRPVALKVLRPELAEELNEVARFQQEARAVAALNHPNTIRLFDFGQADAGSLFLVMEYLQGEPLGSLIKREAPLEPGRVVRIARQIAESLAEAHARDIVHRDLKPANVFLTEIYGKQDFLKVLDFGIAKVRGERAAEGSLTGTGVAIGSPRYIAPEQACGREVTGQADLYALGAILYELLTGGPVFRRRSSTDYMLAHIKEEPPPPTRDGEPLHGPLPDLIMACLEKLPGRRPEGATGLLEALARAEAEPLTSAPAPGAGVPRGETRRLDAGVVAPAGPGVTGEGTDPSPTSTGRAPLERPEAAPGASPSAAAPSPVTSRPAPWKVALAAWLVLVLAGGGAAFWWWADQPEADAAAAAGDEALAAAGSPADPGGPAAREEEHPPEEPAVPSEAPAEVAEVAPARTVEEPPEQAPPDREVPPDREGPAEHPEPAAEEPAAPDEPADSAETPPETAEHMIRIDSAPRGARVYADGELLGRTPLEHRWTGEAGETTLVVRRGGYRRATVRLATLAGREEHTVRLERRPKAKKDPEPLPAPMPAETGYGRLR